MAGGLRDRQADTKRGKKSTGNALGIAIIAVVVILVGIIMYTFVSVSSEIAPRDKDTLCRTDGKFNKHIILLDITGTYSLIQYKTIREAIEKEVAGLELEEQLQLYFITNDVTSGMKPLMSVCNPGQGENVDSFFGNPKMIKKKWEDKLYDPLNKILTEFDSTLKTANKSPIFETIQMVNNLSIKKSVEGTKSRLTIISDFIQNSNDYSFFTNRIDRFWKSNYQHKIYTEFTNVDVQLLFVRRNGREEFLTKKYLDFWKEFFTRSGSKNVMIHRIEG